MDELATMQYVVFECSISNVENEYVFFKPFFCL